MDVTSNSALSIGGRRKLNKGWSGCQKLSSGLAAHWVDATLFYLVMVWIQTAVQAGLRSSCIFFLTEAQVDKMPIKIC